MPDIVDAWSAEWSRLKKLNRWRSAFTLTSIAVGIAYLVGLPTLAVAILLVPSLAFLLVLNSTLGEFNCPRCGQRFFVTSMRRFGWVELADSLRSGCAKCGLKKFTPSFEAKVLPEITGKGDSL